MTTKIKCKISTWQKDRQKMIISVADAAIFSIATRKYKMKTTFMNKINLQGLHWPLGK